MTGQRLQPVVAADAVFLVHHQVALGNFRRFRDELVGALAPTRRTADALAQQVLLAHQGELVGDEAALDPERDQRHRPDRSAADRRPVVLLRGVPEIVLAQQVGEPFARAAGPGGDDDPLPLAVPTFDLAAQLIERVGARAGALEEHRPRSAAAIDADRAVRLGKGREGEQRAAGQHRVPAGLVEIQPIRRQWPVRHLAIARHQPARGVVVLDHLEPRRQHLVRLVVQADRGPGQVVEQRLHPLVEQGHPVLHAGMPPTVRDRQIDRVVGRRLAEGLPPSRAEPRDRVRVERHLRDRPQDQTLALIGAALGSGIEDADRLDRVAEQVEPHRIRLAGREDVDDAAAHGVFAWLHHRAGAAVAVGLQEAGELLRLHGAVGAQFQAGVGERRAGWNALDQRVHRGEHDARSSGLFQQACERGDALRHQRRVRRHAVVGEAVPGGEAQHLGLRSGEGQRLGQACHPRIVAGGVQDGAGELAAAAGQQEGVPPLRRAEDRSDGHGRTLGRVMEGLGGKSKSGARK